ncbi:hypothetical protein [Clostridium saudiense]|uniref:hypothetical protein n=1 Tax=Clostridium saudiense TaxID=1414720 RepID=UPI00319DF844
MKFENFEVEEMYYELHRKYGILHSISIDKNKLFTYEDLELLEEDFKMLNEEDW